MLNEQKKNKPSTVLIFLIYIIFGDIIDSAHFYTNAITTNMLVSTVQRTEIYESLMIGKNI